MIHLKDFSAYDCSPDTPVREVLKRLDSTAHLFQIVTDENRRLIGTVTDGDIRRAMLHGISLDDTARACMQSQPVTGRVGDDAGNRVKLMNLGSTRSFLPILDDDGIVREILAAGGAGRIRSALVMAGGLGTRLGERTQHTPKPLLDVGGRPILDHVLSSLESAGMEEVFVSVHYLADKIEAFVQDRNNKARIDLIHEPKRLGTAGAIGLLNERARREPMLVVNGDVITDVDLAALHEFHHRHDFDGTIAVARYDVDIPFGVIRYGEDGLLDGIEEKPCVSHFIAAGVYYLSPEYLALIPGDTPMDMPDLLNLGKKIGLRTGLFPIHEYWTDIGRPDDLEAAEAVHTERDAQSAPVVSLGAAGGAGEGSGSGS